MIASTFEGSPGIPILHSRDLVNWTTIGAVVADTAQLIVGYSAAKAAYLGMVRSLATELGPANIRVNAIAPGWIETPRFISDLQPRRSSTVSSCLWTAVPASASDVGPLACRAANPPELATSLLLRIDSECEALEKGRAA